MPHPTPAEIESRLERLLLSVERPARYIGGEYNQIVKAWTPDRVTVCLAFPDIYDLGMSNLGLAILYDLLNAHDTILAERAYLPWLDMEAALRREHIPLYSLETKHPVAQFDILGLSLPYEQLYTNALNFLDLAGIPLLAADRTTAHPIVVSGGHSTYNPEPMADFIDAFVIGEGEDASLAIAEAVRTWKLAGRPGGRRDLLRRLARLNGLYIPQFYDVAYHPDGTLARVTPTDDAAQFPVLKTITRQLPPPPTRFLVPLVDTVHNRAAIEIMRGCTRGCRFCHAGMVTRPVRERSVEEIVAAVGEMIRNTGFEEVSLLSLSSSDYRDIGPLVDAIAANFGHLNLNISLPSLRIETTSVDLMDKLKAAGRRGGFTLAPEAATERMREIINKPVSTEQLLTTAREIYSRGWRTLKLYFMIGHPAETLEDVQAIADLAKAVLKEGRRVIGNKAILNVGISTFIPKPHTPFQWSPADTREQIEAKQALLRRELYRDKAIKVSLTPPNESLMEAWLSRGDRRLGAVIYSAWRRGARFDAWGDQFNFNAWLTAFDEIGLDPYFYTHRQRTRDEILPWDHIDAAVKKSFLWEDWQWSQNSRTRVDCRNHCFACGILPKFIDLRRDTPADAWECPPVKPKHLRGQGPALTEMPAAAPTPSLISLE